MEATILHTVNISSIVKQCNKSGSAADVLCVRQ